MSQEEKKDYSSTLQLPRTSFSMRANLLNMEPAHQQRWEEIDLLNRTFEAEAPKGPYVFHDGPPYANGLIHMGHLLNKILKDLVVRSRLMQGFGVRYVPGWDCHGLPIEHKVLKELGKEGKELGTLEVRHRCHDYARKYVGLQSEQMKRLGTLAEYEDPYLTMTPSYEGAVLEVFATLVAEGLVYRDVKPVHWSIANQTALAEAELEYYDRKDTSVYVLFELSDMTALPAGLNAPAGEVVNLMIWTTTPWTLPANLAVAAGPGIDYVLVQFELSGKVHYAVVAEALASKIFTMRGISGAQTLGRCTGQELADAKLTYHHPFVEKEGVVVKADYVTIEDGTGLVHTAPGHGAEDYFTGIHEGLPIYCPVQADGTFDHSVPEWLQGIDVWKANGMIVEHLRESGHLFFDHEYDHSYPHDWRSKTPTIFRATEQWFISVDKPFGSDSMSLRSRAQRAAGKEIRFVPEWGRSRLEGMLEARPDWCISRQRAWGLPIPAFLNGDGEELLTKESVEAVARVVRKHGSDFWFEADVPSLLEDYDPKQDPEAPEWAKAAGRDGLSRLQKGEDIFDVWFESGSSWNGVLRERGMGFPADLYLEGSDQHRGWFQLSLLPSLGATGVSPFNTVLTHGFTLDAKGMKMSKSLGNAIEVQDVLKNYGADICRWWVSSLNYTNDIKVDWEFFKVASDEYRKVRNTIRFLLGNLADFDPAVHSYEFTDADSKSVDAWAMGQLADLVKEVLEGYESFQFKRVAESIFDFCNDAMSSVYMVAVKDRLYCDAVDSPRRRRTQTAMYEIAQVLIRVAAPILVHTAEEAWLALNGLEMESTNSVHLTHFPEIHSSRADQGWTKVIDFRQQVLKAVEDAKASKGFKNPMDAGVSAVVPAALLEVLADFESELADLCGLSRLSLQVGDTMSLEVIDLSDAPRCERSWKRDTTVRVRSDGGMLSDRDAAVLGV